MASPDIWNGNCHRKKPKTKGICPQNNRQIRKTNYN